MFHYHQQTLHCENRSLAEVARVIGTPFYVYSQAELEDGARAYRFCLSGDPRPRGPARCDARSAARDVLDRLARRRLPDGDDILWRRGGVEKFHKLCSSGSVG